jgi:hypothetical protein
MILIFETYQELCMVSPELPRISQNFKYLKFQTLLTSTLTPLRGRGKWGFRTKDKKISLQEASKGTLDVLIGIL